jgi:cobalt transporter subunit CbtA
MIFSRIIYSAILIGVVTGVLLTLMQLASLTPIIQAAEQYEQTESDHHDADDAAAHSHESAWMPAAGFERSAFTFIANILASTGFAAILLALMVQSRAGGGRISWSQGSLWGLAGYCVIFLAPALGLPPEIPGVEAAPVAHRQLWWLLTVISVAIGLGIIAFTINKLKALGLIFLAMPYLVGAPHNDAANFANVEVEVAAILQSLQQKFILLSAGTNLLFWLLLALVCTYVFNRWFKETLNGAGYADA